MTNHRRRGRFAPHDAIVNGVTKRLGKSTGLHQKVDRRGNDLFHIASVKVQQTTALGDGLEQKFHDCGGQVRERRRKNAAREYGRSGPKIRSAELHPRSLLTISAIVDSKTSSPPNVIPSRCNLVVSITLPPVLRWPETGDGLPAIRFAISATS